jgi:hypothetical protein
MKRLIAERPDRLGILLTPSNGNAEWWQPEHTWACDNDCFRALDAPAYLRMVARVAGFKSRPSWIACPDAVGDMGETWRRYTIWSRVLLEMGLPVALVMQDGLERLKWRARLPSTWDELSAVFVGGSTAWKLSDEAGQLTLQAHERGLKVHYGRVNTFRRILWLGRGIRDGRLWCDTFDGTGFSAYGDKRIPLAIKWIDKAMNCKQGVMFGGVA